MPALATGPSLLPNSDTLLPTLLKHSVRSTTMHSPRVDAVPRRARQGFRHAFLRTLMSSALVTASLVCAPFAHGDELQDVSKLVSTGKLDEAEKRADVFLVANPKDAQMRFLKGVILAQRGKRPEAIEAFTTITQDYPELPEPYNNLAVIFAAQGQYDKAREALESAVRVAPNDATAHENLGDVYAALAARSYRDARRYDATNAPALRKLDAVRVLLTPPAGTANATAAAVTPASGPTAPAAVAPTTIASATTTTATTTTTAGGPAPVVSPPAAVAAAAPASAPAPAPPPAPAPEATRSQRNVGLASPASPPAVVVGFGAEAPEIVVPPNVASVPQGSNVVAIDAPPPAPQVATSTLTGTATLIGADPAQAIGAVSAAVRRWATAHSVTTVDLKIRIDGDVATARFQDQQPGPARAVLPRRALTLKRNGDNWVVTDLRTET
jgi:hypothetical protein